MTEGGGWKTEARVFVDSSAAVGIVNRKGNRKLRHVKVGMLWIQERVEDGELEVLKIKWGKPSRFDGKASAGKEDTTTH